MLDTTNWVKYPFTVQGVDFISMLDPKGDFYPQVERLPEGVFLQWNTQMVNDVIGDVSTMTRSELIKKIDEVNEGATQALVAVA